MADVGYINKEVQKMYGIPYHKLTAEQKKILHEDSKRRAKLIAERQKAVMENGAKAFEDEAKLERVLGTLYKNCQSQILADVAETMKKVKKAGGTWSYANQSALTRSRGLFEQITKELNKLGQSEQALFTQGLSAIYTDQFLRQIYTLGQTMPVKANFNRLNPVLIKQTLDYPWSGAMFSDRLWLDKETLGRNLRAGLTQSMILGEGIPEITDRINRNINTSRYNAERVARTETKRVAYVAHRDAYEDTGVKTLEYRVANGGDHRVCSTCMADNGKQYKMGEEPTLPRHPNCRCIYIPVVPDTFGDNELNELTGSVRGAENYEKWRKAEAEKQKNANKPLNIPDKPDYTTVQGTNAFTGELGKQIRESFDASLGSPTWTDSKEKMLQELYEQRNLLKDANSIKQLDRVIKNHEEYKALANTKGVLIELKSSGTFNVDIPPSQHVSESVRNSSYYNRYEYVSCSYHKYNYDVYEERLGGKYYITMTGVSSKKEREEIYAIADKVFTHNTRAIGAKLRIDTVSCNKRNTATTTNLGFYEPSHHRLTVRTFKSYADIYGLDRQGGKDHFAGTLAHEFAHVVHSTNAKLSAVTATAQQWDKWKDLVEPYYEQYRVNKIVNVGAEWRRMNYPINAEDYYRDRSKEHYYQEMWAECTAILQEDVSAEKKVEEVGKLKKYFPKVSEFITEFYKGGL